MKVAVLSYPQAVPSSITGPRDIFLKTNDLFRKVYPRFGKDFFDVEVVGEATVLPNSNQF